MINIMTTAAKAILNRLKCPICKSPVDIIIIKSTSYSCNYGCVNNVDHYVLRLDDDYGTPFLTHEVVHIYDYSNKYKIIKLHFGTKIETVVKIYNVDPEGREIFSFKEKKIEVDFDAFDFSKFNREKALNRIKNLFVFT